MCLLRAPVLLIISFALSAPLFRAQELSAQDRLRADLHLPLGASDNGSYHNAEFGFRYKIPYGWVERTEQMRDSSTAATKSLLLLAVFERPPEAQGETVNSAVVITAESMSAYPGLKSAADYFAPLTDVATGKGFSVVNEPYYFQVGTKQVVRGDFSKKVGDVTMYQSSMVVLEKGYFVSFTFLGGSEDEVNEFTEKLSFSGATSKKSPVSK
jgi:hypothetical protein